MDVTHKTMIDLLDGIARDQSKIPESYNCSVFNPQSLRREWHIVLHTPYRRVAIAFDMSNKLFQLIGATAWVDGIDVLEKLGEIDKRFITLLAIPRDEEKSKS